jgi:rare lipoprotein A
MCAVAPNAPFFGLASSERERRDLEQGASVVAVTSVPSRYVVATLACAVLFGCAQPERDPEPVQPPPVPPPATPASAGDAGTGMQQRGRISHYGDAFAGRTTASGEPFDPGALTMAHRTLPFGTRVRVTNLENQRSVEVVVNDRGPFAAGRIADLSAAAARRIGMVAEGVVEALLEIVQPGKTRQVR